MLHHGSPAANVYVITQPSMRWLIEINCRPSILDNIDHWQAFYDDKHVLRFIHNLQEFEDCEISYKKEGKEYWEHEENVKNHILKGLISLEKLFDIQDRHKNKKETSWGLYVLFTYLYHSWIS